MTDPTKCPECKGPMKPLFSGYYCPLDCDKPEVLAARKAKAAAEAEEAEEKDKKQGSWGGYIFANPNQIYITGNKVTGTPATRRGIAVTPSQTPASTQYPQLIAGSQLVIPRSGGSWVTYQRRQPCFSHNCPNTALLYEVAQGQYSYICSNGHHHGIP